MCLKVTLGEKEEGERLAGSRALLNRGTMALNPKVAFPCPFPNLLQQSIVDSREKTPMISSSPDVSACHASSSFAGSLDLG